MRTRNKWTAGAALALLASGAWAQQNTPLAPGEAGPPST